MSEDDESEESVVAQTDKSKKKPKVKKRPSDFEIVRTILQRTTERKQAYLLKNIGEDSDVLFLCSANEKGFTYGSAELSIAMIEITDPALKEMTDGFLSKLYGLNVDVPFSGFVSLRDQISELAKTKGESIEGNIKTNQFGSAWLMKADKNGREQSSCLSICIESLFHVQLVAQYSKIYRQMLDGNNPEYLYYPYVHTDTETSSILTLPPGSDPEHRLTKLYPHGFRTLATKGLDVLVSKAIPEQFPYPVHEEHLIVFHEQGMACQFVHRIIADGWRMIVTRPNAIYFPTPNTTLPDAGHHYL